jgi:SAM-dependent methyltransferase
VGKEGEKNYLKNIGFDGVRHAANKPFSDVHCGDYLIAMGAFMSILPPPPARVLDLGCGSGWTSYFLAKRGYDVTGVDIAEDFITLARQNRDNLDNLRFEVADYEALTYEEEFDAVVFFDALHHAEDEALAVRRAHRALKPGGYCICSEPGKGHAHADTSVRAVEEFDVTEKDMPPRKIIRLGRAAGFRRFKVFPAPGFVGGGIYNDVLPRGWKRIIKPRFLRDIAKFLRLVFQKKKAAVVLMIK